MGVYGILINLNTVLGMWECKRGVLCTHRGLLFPGCHHSRVMGGGGESCVCYQVIIYLRVRPAEIGLTFSMTQLSNLCKYTFLMHMAYHFLFCTCPPKCTKRLNVKLHNHVVAQDYSEKSMCYANYYCVSKDGDFSVILGF